MTAFVSFVRTYAVWIYLLCGLGILLGIKMLVDARRLSRTTLFSLEQERAGEQSYRAILLIAALLLVMGGLTFVHVLIAPLTPMPEPVVVRSPTATFAALIFPTGTLVPTATPTLPKPTEVVPSAPLGTGAPGTAIATPILPTRVVKVTIPPPSPPPPPTLTPPLPAPRITGPLPNGGTFLGEGKRNAAITFSWTWDCNQCVLGPNDRFVITITYVDKATGVTRMVGGGTRDNFLALGRIIDGGGIELYQKAKEDQYQWYVQVRRDTGDIPMTSPSETWKFVWK